MRRHMWSRQHHIGWKTASGAEPPASAVPGSGAERELPVVPFMEWVTRMDMDMEWISGGYGYFFVKSFGVEWIMG